MRKIQPINKNIIFPYPRNDFDSTLISNIKDDGWSIIAQNRSENSPGYIYSVGLFYSFNIPEILIMGLDPKTAFSILKLAAEKYKTTVEFYNKMEFIEVANIPLSSIEISIRYYNEFLSFGMWLYKNYPRPFPATQLIYPDQNKLLPWDNGYDKSMSKFQIILNSEIIKPSSAESE